MTPVPVAVVKNIKNAAAADAHFLQLYFHPEAGITADAGRLPVITFDQAGMGNCNKLLHGLDIEQLL